MQVALTGATGFVGRYTLDRLVQAGHRVRALTRREQPARVGVEWIEGSLEDAASLDRLCEGCEAVLHVAGVVGARDKQGFERANVAGTALMLAAAEQASANRFVHISSLAAREPDLSLYGASKRRSEDEVMRSSLDWTIVRPPAVYGPGDTEMRDAFAAIARGVAPMPPRGRLSLIHADDLARLLVRLVEPEIASGTILEPDDGHADGWSHAEFARMIGDAFGKKPVVLHLPRTLMKAAAFLDEAIRGDSAKLTRDRASYLCHDDWVARPAFHPDPALWTARIDSKEGIRQTARWYGGGG